jgi:hypothetical protein
MVAGDQRSPHLQGTPNGWHLIREKEVAKGRAAES